MNWHSLSLPLIVIGVLTYHLSQKSIPKDANPIVVFAAAYTVAVGLCIVLLLATGEFKKGTELLRDQNWLVVVLIGVSAIAVEFGYLYAYRTGWRISTTSITTGAFVTTSLALIGVFWFKEHLTSLNVVGIVLCLVGVMCVTTK
ncbi:MAG: EamA family transporter [Ignavibacteriales bacterium]|nr:EamA family transporter [Ignavibacteriales bacterium]